METPIQENFNFEVESFTETAFLNFTESEFFNEIIEFALQRGTFISIGLKAKDLGIIHSNLLKKQNIFEKAADARDKKYCFLSSFWKYRKDRELEFMDILKTLISEGKTFIGIFNKEKPLKFRLYDLESRVLASVMLDFECDIKFSANMKETLPTLAECFFKKNGLKIDKEVVNLILRYSSRDIKAFGVILENLKDYSLQTLQKPTKKNFKHILTEYEKRKNRENL